MRKEEKRPSIVKLYDDQFVAKEKIRRKLYG
jgi:hypothetical protein